MEISTHFRPLYFVLVVVALGFLPAQVESKTWFDANEIALFEIYGVDEDEWIVPLTEQTKQPEELYGTARFDFQSSSDSADDISFKMLSFERRVELYKSFTVSYGLALTNASGSRRSQSANVNLRTDANGIGAYVGLRLDSLRVGPTHLFFEGAIGTILGSDNLPPDGDNLVLFQRYTIGLTLPVTDQWHMLVGASHMRFHSQAQCCSGSTSLATNGGFIAISYEY